MPTWPEPTPGPAQDLQPARRPGRSPALTPAMLLPRQSTPCPTSPRKPARAISAQFSLCRRPRSRAAGPRACAFNTWLGPAKLPSSKNNADALSRRKCPSDSCACSSHTGRLPTRWAKSHHLLQWERWEFRVSAGHSHLWVRCVLLSGSYVSLLVLTHSRGLTPLLAFPTCSSRLPAAFPLTATGHTIACFSCPTRAQERGAELSVTCLFPSPRTVPGT